MKRGIISLVVASSFAGLPMTAIAEDQPAEKTTTTTTETKNSKEADAAWKEIEKLKVPELDRSKVKDQEYVTQFFKDLKTWAEKRSTLAKEFVAKYPNDSRKADALYNAVEALMNANARDEEFTSLVHEFVKTAPKDERGAMPLFRVASMERGNPEKQLKLMQQVVEKYPKSEAAQMARGRIRQVEGVGKPFELAFKDVISGKDVATKDLKGKVIVIDFWATWCGPCVAEMPEMKKLYAEYKDKGVEFIGVSLDSPEDQGGLKQLKEFVAKNEIPWPQYYQGKGWQSEFSRDWGINGIPTLFVVDTEGNLHSTRARGQLNEMIPDLLKKAKKEVSLK